MKSIGVLIPLLCATSVVLAENLDSAKTFTVTGVYVADESSLLSGNATPPGDQETDDWSSATVAVSYTTENEAGALESVELEAKGFVDGKVSLAGEISEPTDIVISVRTETNRSLSLSTVATPGGEEISFVLMNFQSFPPDRLALVGSYRRVKDLSKKFTISGDFSSIDKNLTSANVRVNGWGYDGNGNQKEIGSGDMLLDDGKFVFEGEIDESDVVSIFVQGHDPYFRSMTQAVVEQGSAIRVYAPDGSNQIVAVADMEESGRHAKLIESWQQSDEYLATLQEHAEALREFEAQREAEPLVIDEASAGSESAANTTKNEEPAKREENAEADLEETSKESSGTQNDVAVAEGCEHVSLAKVKREVRNLSDLDNLPRHYYLSQRLAKMESDGLEHIASNAVDPFDALLAMELGAFNFRSENRKQGLVVYDRIAEMLDKELVARRVAPSRDSLASYIEVNDNDKNLVPGQKAPNFKHSDLEGKDISLQDVLAENEVVLVDFWASWCAPCIAKFPEMKEFYGEYGDKGFEVLSLSIDSTWEAWEQASKVHGLPWTSLGEIEGWAGSTAHTYGVQHIPKSYLLDSEGCITQKDITLEDLEKVLANQFGDFATID